MSNDSDIEKMAVVLKECGQYFKNISSGCKEYTEKQSPTEKEKRDLIMDSLTKAKLEDIINSLTELNNLVIKLDCIFIDSSVYDDILKRNSLDLLSILYYQSMRTKLMMSIDGNSKILDIIIKGSDVSDIVEIVGDMLRKGMDSLEEHSNG